MKSFIDYCKDYIEEHLVYFEDMDVYLSDLALDLTYGPNMDGSLTYDRSEAIEYLREWWFDAADYYDYARSELGDTRNPFANPEEFMVCMVIEGVNNLMWSAYYELGLDTDKKTKLTAEIIKKIVESVKNNDTQKLF